MDNLYISPGLYRSGRNMSLLSNSFGTSTDWCTSCAAQVRIFQIACRPNESFCVLCVAGLVVFLALLLATRGFGSRSGLRDSTARYLGERIDSDMT